MEKMPTNKPKWLQKLEEESWQAELVVSGAAIYGSWQLPNLLDEMAGSLIGWFSTEANLALYLFFTYAFIMAYALIVAFIVHFVLRAFWIGLVGLNSVFPNGIIIEKGNFPKHFMERFVQDSAYDQSVIQSLDNVCSIIFAGCAYFVLVFLVISMDVFILFGIWSLLCALIPAETATHIIIGMVSFFLFFSSLSLLFNWKILKNNAFVKKHHYRFFTWGHKLVFHVFYRPIYYLRFTLMTNFSLRKYYFWTILFMVTIFVFAGFRLVDSNAIYFSNGKKLEEMYHRPDRLRSENYDNLRKPEHGRILSTAIEADRLDGESMRVFIPVFRNEKTIWQKDCGKFETPSDLDKDQQRKLRGQHTLQCLENAHRIFVNDSLYLPEFQLFNHENKGEYGILTYLSTTNFKEGKNILKVEKATMDSVYRTMLVPFWFEKTNR